MLQIIICTPQNDQIKGEQTTHLKKLVEEAKVFAEKLRAAKTITREDVEKAMLRKLDCGREADKELKLMEEKIVLLDCELEKSHEELDKMTTYKVCTCTVAMLYVYICYNTPTSALSDL